MRQIEPVIRADYTEFTDVLAMMVEEVMAEMYGENKWLDDTLHGLVQHDYHLWDNRRIRVVNLELLKQHDKYYELWPSAHIAAWYSFERKSIFLNSFSVRHHIQKFLGLGGNMETLAPSIRKSLIHETFHADQYENFGAEKLLRDPIVSARQEAILVFFLEQEAYMKTLAIIWKFDTEKYRKGYYNQNIFGAVPKNYAYSGGAFDNLGFKTEFPEYADRKAWYQSPLFMSDEEFREHLKHIANAGPDEMRGITDGGIDFIMRKFERSVDDVQRNFINARDMQQHLDLSDGTPNPRLDAILRPKDDPLSVNVRRIIKANSK